MKSLDNAPDCHILYEDNHLLALEKPPGLLTQPSPEQTHSLETLAKQWMKKTYQKSHGVYLHAIHRLDREVGGVVLFAKSSKALSRLQKMMREQKIRRIYHARVDGVMDPSAGKLEDTLMHASHRSLVVEKGRDGGKIALLHYKTLESTAKTSLLEIELITGRYHQIRVQLAHAKHPIIGDVKYGGRADKLIQLTHVRMEFVHPVTLESVVIKSTGQ